MTPDTINHLLILCAVRGAEIASSMKLALGAGVHHSGEFKNLLAEQEANSRAVAELKDALAVAA